MTEPTEIEIRHVTRYAYDPAADRAGLRIKLFPAETAAQRVLAWEVTVNGAPVSPALTNPMGDGEALWFAPTKVSEIEIVANGRVQLTDTSGVLGKFGQARPSIFLRESELTEPDEAIRALAAGIEGETDLARMHALNTAIHESVTYRKGVTEGTTTAAQALALGAGVCQDLTHLLVATARAMGLPARYVAGYHAGDSDERATHAWAEVYLDGLGWTGFDPTHDLCPAASHIRFCAGLDASDAAPIRGHVIGETAETLEVSVEIGQAQSQSQQQG
ncbi:MAG: transglutaminase family protein [Pseudomonadota bacterium]